MRIFTSVLLDILEVYEVHKSEFQLIGRKISNSRPMDMKLNKCK